MRILSSEQWRRTSCIFKPVQSKYLVCSPVHRPERWCSWSDKFENSKSWRYWPLQQRVRKKKKKLSKKCGIRRGKVEEGKINSGKKPNERPIRAAVEAAFAICFRLYGRSPASLDSAAAVSYVCDLYCAVEISVPLFFLCVFFPTVSICACVFRKILF